MQADSERIKGLNPEYKLKELTGIDHQIRSLRQLKICKRNTKIKQRGNQESLRRPKQENFLIK